MPFDPYSGVFDRKALVRMAQTLPRGADAAAPWLAQLTEAARNYHRWPVRDPKEAEEHKKQRKRLQGELRLFDKTMAILDNYRRNPRLTYDRGAPRTALEALGEVRAQTKSVLNDYDRRIRAHSRTANPRLDLLYGEILRAWTDAGGRRPGVSLNTRTHGPFFTYFTIVNREITSKAPKLGGVRTILRRWLNKDPDGRKKKRGARGSVTLTGRKR